MKHSHPSLLLQFTGIFDPLKDPEYFTQVKVNPELGTIQWPNGADLDPGVLYEVITHSNIDFSTKNTTLL
ncbi:MAG: hypothetical protein RLZZ568_1576 [Cyanobacteriota bacterium]